MSTPALDNLAQVLLGTSLTDVLTVDSQPGNGKVECIVWIVNTDTVERALTLRYGSGSLTAVHSLFAATAMSAGKVYIAPAFGECMLVLKAGWKIQGLCDVADKIAVSVMGYRVLD